MHGKILVPARFRGFLRLWWAVSRPIFRQKIVGRVAGRALRLFRSGDFGWFLLADFVRKSYRPAAVRASWGRDSGLTALQRRPCCNAAGAPLQSREALTESHPDPSQVEGGMMLFVYGYE